MPTLLVDTGYFMADDRGSHGKLRPDALAKDDGVWKSFSQFPVDIVNVSSHDLPYLSSHLSKSKLAARGQPGRLLTQWVSANTVSVSADASAPSSYVIRELRFRATAGGRPASLRVAFVGLTEIEPAPPKGFNYTDPLESARRIIPEARKKADVVIVLAKVTSSRAARIAREAPGADVIIGGSASIEDSFTPPFYVGQTLLVFTPFETRMLGELRFYRLPQNKFSTRQRFISLDELIPNDPAAQRLVDETAIAVKDTLTNAKQLLETWLAASAARTFRKPVAGGSSMTESSPAYVSSSVCSQCHLAQYVKWTGTSHARATDSLVPQSTEFDASCLDCHATGSKPVSGPGALASAIYQSVHCEQCHGPGGDHVAKPGKGYGRIASIQTSCASCHTPETSPGFDIKTAWEKIKH